MNEEAVGPMGRKLFEMEQGDLLSDLVDIPKKACDRRVRLYSVFFFFGGCTKDVFLFPIWIEFMTYTVCTNNLSIFFLHVFCKVFVTKI